MITYHTVRIPITAVFVLVLAAPVHAAEDTRRYALSVDGWLPNINIEDQQGRMTGISRSDIIENLEPSFLGSFVAGRGRFHAGIDFIYLGLSSKGNDEVISEILSLRKTEISSVLMNPFIGYRRTPLGSSSGSTSDSVWVR